MHVHPAKPPLQWNPRWSRISTSRGQMSTCRRKKPVRAINSLFPPKTCVLERLYQVCHIGNASRFEIRPSHGHRARRLNARLTCCWLNVSPSCGHTKQEQVCPLHRRWNTYFHPNHTLCDFIWIPPLLDVSFQFQLPFYELPNCQLSNSWLVVPGVHTGFRIWL